MQAMKVLQSERLISVTILVTIVTKMITILKPGCRSIMHLFYKNKAARLHLREIARQAGLHEPSATRFLKALEKEGILKSEKDGNMKKYSVKSAKRAYLIFEMFDIERLESLPFIRRNAIKQYLDSLQEKPVFAVLFGSTAKGTYREDSDIDMLIVTNRKIDASGAEKEAEALTAMRISTFQMALKGFLTELKLKEEHVIQSAIASGFPLINHIAYYEALHG